MAEIRRFYEALNKFWREEISHVAEALEKCRVDPRDFERWNSSHPSLKHAIEFWKVCVFLHHYAFPTDQILCPEPAIKRRYPSAAKQ